MTVNELLNELNDARYNVYYRKLHKNNTKTDVLVASIPNKESTLKYYSDRKVLEYTINDNEYNLYIR